MLLEVWTICYSTCDAWGCWSKFSFGSITATGGGGIEINSWSEPNPWGSTTNGGPGGSGGGGAGHAGTHAPNYDGGAVKYSTNFTRSRK